MVKNNYVYFIIFKQLFNRILKIGKLQKANPQSLVFEATEHQTKLPKTSLKCTRNFIACKMYSICITCSTCIEGGWWGGGGILVLGTYERFALCMQIPKEIKYKQKKDGKNVFFFSFFNCFNYFVNWTCAFASVHLTLLICWLFL